MKHDCVRNAKTIQLRGEQLLLHPDKVLYWPAYKTLLVADIHVGKEYAFARSGIPVPEGISEHTLDRLMRNVDLFAAERLIILGDLLHATPALSESWQQHLLKHLSDRSALSVHAVIGNHDSAEARSRVIANIDWSHQLNVAPFLFRHEPGKETEAYVMAGHIHPVYRLRKGRRNSLRAAAFWVREHYAVMPAFGEFTGGHVVERHRDDRMFMIGGGGVMEV